MKNNQRIISILKTPSLDLYVTGFKSFNLSELELLGNLDFELPANLRLGHLAEKVVSKLIKTSTNYNVLYENIQLIEEGKTIGEIDFIISEKETKQIIHLELAYKFYLFDPNYSSLEINNWIGPNRNDSLTQKLEKIKTKQFPLLHHKAAQEKFKDINIKEASQKLCLLVSLYIPYTYKAEFTPVFQKAIKGYYVNAEKFTDFDHSEKKYCLPSKKKWGIDPSHNEDWMSFKEIEQEMNSSISEKQSRLCWEKHNNSYSQLFIVWW